MNSIEKGMCLLHENLCLCLAYKTVSGVNGPLVILDGVKVC